MMNRLKNRWAVMIPAAAVAMVVGLIPMGSAIGGQDPHERHPGGEHGAIDFVAMVQAHHPEADTDGDGVVSKGEAKAFIERMHADRSKDTRMEHGSRMEQLHKLLDHLNKLESPTAPEGLDLKGHHEAIDTNGDGSISDGEWVAFTKEMRPKMLTHLLAFAPDADIDEDGEISDEELSAFRLVATAKLRAFVLRHHPETDTDGDGTLSDDEFEAFEKVFEAIQGKVILQKHPEADTNGDGVLSPEEAGAFKANMHAEYGHGAHGWKSDHDGHDHGDGHGS